MGVRRRHLAGAHRQSALRRHRTPRLFWRPAVLREVRRHPVRRLHDHRTSGPRHRRRVRAPNGLASRGTAVDRFARADRRLDRSVPRRRRPRALEPRSPDDARPVEPLHHSRHRARPRRRSVGLATLGSRLAVGDTARSPSWCSAGWCSPWCSWCRSSARSGSACCGSLPSATRLPARSRSTSCARLGSPHWNWRRRCAIYPTSSSSSPSWRPSASARPTGSDPAGSTPPPHARP